MADRGVTRFFRFPGLACLTTCLLVVVSAMTVPVGAKDNAPTKADSTAATATPKIVLEKASYDFGKVSQGEIVKHDFRVVNRGKGELEIKEVKPG